MEGKAAILGVLIMSLVMAQVQVEARICCANVAARNVFTGCRGEGKSIYTCLDTSGCINFPGTGCRPGYFDGILQNSGDDAVFNEYCKLGCTSSVCGAMTTLLNSDASEVVNGAVEQCTKACSTFCTKGSMTAVKTA